MLSLPRFNHMSVSGYVLPQRSSAAVVLAVAEQTPCHGHASMPRCSELGAQQGHAGPPWVTQQALRNASRPAHLSDTAPGPESGHWWQQFPGSAVIMTASVGASECHDAMATGKASYRTVLTSWGWYHSNQAGLGCNGSTPLYCKRAQLMPSAAPDDSSSAAVHCCNFQGPKHFGSAQLQYRVTHCQAIAMDSTLSPELNLSSPGSVR